jgi:hypothetical protein
MKAVSDILDHGFEQADAASLTTGLLYLLLPTEREAGSSHGILLAQARTLVLFDLMVQMKTKLFVQLQFRNVPLK